MELYIFLLGCCFCLHSLMAYTFLRTRHQRAPYREAFGWVNLVYALQLLIDFPIVDHLFDPHFINIKMAKDMLGLPFGAMEIVCLFFQNTARLSWRKRWHHLILHETVFVLFLIATLTTEWSLLPHLMMIYSLGFTVVISLACYKRLKSYEHLLRTTESHHDTSLRWIVLIYVLYQLFFTIYIIVFYFEALPKWLFLLSSLVVWMIHAKYITRQRPMDIYSLEKARKRMEQDMRQAMNTLSKQTSDLNERAEKLKNKADMHTYIETFRLQHPTFESQIRALTPTRLTERDLYICMLISDGKKTTALAHSLGIDPKSVEVARSRLRKKLQLQPDQDLNQIIASCI